MPITMKSGKEYYTVVERMDMLLEEIGKAKYEINPNSITKLKNSIKFSFFHEKNQIDHISNQIKLYSNHAVGLGKLLQQSDLQLIFRRFKKI